MKRVTEWSSTRLSRVTPSQEKTGLVDVQVRDRLVDPDQRHLLADDCSLEHLIGQNDLCVIPRACRYTDFAVCKALEHHGDLIGLQQDVAHFHGAPWFSKMSRNASAQ